MARPITKDDIPSKQDYEETRDRFRRRIMVQKRSRRVLIGSNCSAHFENRDIMLYQILEMLRCEGTWKDPHAIEDEIEVYNPLISQPGLLSVTFMFEYPSQEERERELPKLVGIDKHIWLQIGDSERILGVFDAGQIDEAKVSSVQYVKFPLTPERSRLLGTEGTVIRLIIDHPQYGAQAVLGEETRRAVAEDLLA